MDHLTNDRKMEHIAIISGDEETDRRKNYFDRLHLKHRALPELDLHRVDPSIEFMGKRLSFPLLISSMTGGMQETVMRINRNLALAAEATGVAMAVGSQRVMFTHKEARASFELRPFAPAALLFANLGAVQLNRGFGLDHCRQALEVLDADALYFHLNPLQEAVQPEGDVDFSGLAEKIGAASRSLPKPVIVKEVGAGISPQDARLLASQGIRFIDVAGSGGTSWSRIEHFRRQSAQPDDLGLLFQDWGNPTPLALRALSPLRPQITLIASGGIRSGIDMVKAIVLGASLCGLAKPFLKPAMDSPEAVIETIGRLKREFTVAMFLVGAGNIRQLQGNDDLLWNPNFDLD